MIYTGNRSMNSDSYEPEITRWIADRSQDNDCVADRAIRETGLRLVNEAADDFITDEEGCWVVCWNDDGWDSEVLLGSYGLSDDDLETLTII